MTRCMKQAFQLELEGRPAEIRRLKGGDCEAFYLDLLPCVCIDSRTSWGGLFIRGNYSDPLTIASTTSAIHARTVGNSNPRPYSRRSDLRADFV